MLVLLFSSCYFHEGIIVRLSNSLKLCKLEQSLDIYYCMVQRKSLL